MLETLFSKVEALTVQYNRGDISRELYLSELDTLKRELAQLTEQITHKFFNLNPRDAAVFARDMTDSILPL